MAAGIYLHWPFCPTRCTFCDFVTTLDNTARRERYAEALLAEIRAFDASTAAGLGDVDTVYWGGGTPSLMPLEVMEAAHGALAARFRMATDIEISLEVNPGTVPPAHAAAYRRLGVNRVSLGVESMQDAELDLVERRHGSMECLETFAICREAGFDNLNCDLICGLPEQSRDGWRQTVARVIAWAPEHVSVYLLELHASTPLFRQVETGQRSLPADEEVVDRYQACIDAFEAAGLRQYEISNFARPGCESRHNLKYWSDEPFVGFGAGSHSNYGGFHYGNDKSLEGYLRRVEEAGSGVAESEAVDFEHWLGNYAITALRKRQGIDLEAFRVRYGFAFEERFAASIAELAELGMVETRHGFLRLTRAALVVSNEVLQEFI